MSKRVSNKKGTTHRRTVRPARTQPKVRKWAKRAAINRGMLERLKATIMGDGL